MSSAQVNVTFFDVDSPDATAFGLGIIETSDDAVFRIEFSAPVAGVTPDDFAVFDSSFTQVMAGGPQVTAVSGGPSIYTLTLNRNGNSGLFRVGLPTVGDIVPTGGGTVNPPGLFPSATFTAGRPYLVDWLEINPDTGLPFVPPDFPDWGNFAYFRLVFSEPVSGFDSADIGFAQWLGPPPNPDVTVTDGPTTYDVVFDAEGKTGFAVPVITPAATITAVGSGEPLLNDPSFGIGGLQFELSGGPPTASLGLILSPRNTMPDPIFFSYDEPVVNVSPSLLTVERSDGMGGWINVPFTGTLNTITASAYSVDMTYTGGTPDGECRVTLAVGTVEDVDNNPPAAGDTEMFTLDATPPQLASATTTTPGPVSPGNFEYTFTFTEPVTDFGPFDVGKTLTGSAMATVDPGSFVPVPGQPNQARFTVALAGSGTVSLGCIPGGVFDAAGNASAAGAFSTPLTVDAAPPSLTTFTSSVPNPSPATSQVVFTLAWNEVVTGFAGGDIQVVASDLTYTSAVLTDTAGGVLGRDYTFTVSGISAGNAGQLTLTIPADAVTDAAAQGNAQRVQVQRVDGTPPTGTITSSEPSPTFDNLIEWNIAFSEPVELEIFAGGGASLEVTLDLTGTATNSLVSQVHQNPATPDFRNYRFTAIGVAGDGTLRPRVAAGAIEDAVGNVSTVAILGTEIQHLSNLVVGNVAVGTAGTTVTIVGPGDYDISAGANVGGLICGSPIQIRGTTITGNGALTLPIDFQPDVTIYSGAFTVNGTTETVTFPAPQASAFTWNTVPIGVCSISLDGGVSLDGWFDVADFAGNSFRGMRMTDFPGLFRPQLDTFHLGNASCSPSQSGMYFATIVPVVGSPSYLQITPEFLPASRNPVLELTATELNAEGYFQQGAGGHAFYYNDVTTTAAGFEFASFYEPEPGVYVALDELNYNNTGGFEIGSSGTITNAAGNLDATFLFNPPYVTDQPLQELVVHTTTAFGDVPLEGLRLVSSGGGAYLFFDAVASKVTLAGIPFTVDGAPEFNDTDGYSAGTITLVDLNAITFSYDSLVVNTATVTLGGGGLSLLGLAFEVSVTTADTGGLEITGGFELPSNLGSLSNISLAASFSIEEGGGFPRINLTGVQFCTPGSDVIKIKNSNWNLPQLCFEYSQTPPEISADVTVGVPEVFDVAAGGSVRDGKVDRISVGLDGLNKPIGATGAFLQSINAEARNLSRTENEWTETYYVFNPGMAPTEVTRTLSGIPPVRVTGTVGATAGPEIGPFSLMEAEVTTFIDETQVRMDGTMTMVIVDVGGGYLHVRWSGPGSGVAFGGYMTYLLVIRGDINAALDFLGNFAGCAAITIQIPDGLPFEGEQFGGVSVCVTAPPFIIRGCVSILEAQLCMSISEDGNVSFGRARDRGRYLESWDTPYYQPTALTRGVSRNGQEETLYFTMFTNYQLARKAYDYEVAKAPTAQRGGTAVQIPVAAGPGRIIRLTYENDGADPSFLLIAPDMTTYTPAMTLGTIDPDTAGAVFFRGDSRREAGYILRDAQDGQYTLNILNAAALGAYSVEVLVPDSEPFIEITDVAVAGSTLNFEWDDQDPDSDATISLGLDSDRVAANGTQLLTGISEDDPANMASFDLAAQPIQPGFYWPYAIIQDSASGPVVSYATNPIFVPDVDASAPIEDFQVGGSDGNASITFTPVDDPEIVSYKLSWTDDQGDWNLINSTAIPAGESALYLPGFEVNQPYKFVLAAVSLVDSSTMRRAERFRAFELALAQASKTGGFDEQVEWARGALSGFEGQLEPKVSRSIALQAAETARANAKWNPSRRSPKFRSFIEKSATVARNTERRGGTTRRYVDSYFAVADNVVFRRAPGTNNAPQFTSTPPAWVQRGSVYEHQLVAVDPDGDSFSFALDAGPLGLTVSTSGAVTWNTAAQALGDVQVRARATDSLGASATLEWTIGVVTLVEPPPFSFASFPETNAAIGETWTYSPTLAGEADDASPVFSLTEAPPGMDVDPVTGEVTWDTTAVLLPPGGLASFRVVLRADEGGAKDRIAIQEFAVNVEDRSDNVIVEPILPPSPNDDGGSAFIDSQYSQDAILYEGATPGVGATVLVAGRRTQAGDNVNNRAERGLLGFTTALTGLNARTARLRLTVDGKTGDIAGLGDLEVFLADPYFGTTQGWQRSDFEAAPSVPGRVGVVPNEDLVNAQVGDAIWIDLDPALVPLTGNVQFRFQFQNRTDGNSSNANIRFGAGGHSVSNRHVRSDLVIEYDLATTNGCGLNPPGGGARVVLDPIYSIPTQDGVVVEFLANSDVGLLTDNANAVAEFGDTATNQRVKALLAFDTSALATYGAPAVVGARLCLTRESVSGNPAQLGRAYLEMVCPNQAAAFGPTSALEREDFEAYAWITDATGGIPALPSSNGQTVCWELSEEALAALNHFGPTQFRIRFENAESDNGAKDTLRFYSGNARENLRPRLELQIEQ
ncbi:MAG: hypothetical protein SF028_03715 [Candidatus Sumerlaeia bacterium]|nr:hypothetical protein [Candidatus Sumerlaeia bacterium]